MIKNRVRDTDKQVEKMVENWDIVRCKICRKKISMLTAMSINDGEYFICQAHK